MTRRVRLWRKRAKRKRVFSHRPSWTAHDTDGQIITLRVVDGMVTLEWK